MFGNIGKIPIIGDLTGSNKNAHLKGNVVLVRKTVLGLDVTSIAGSLLDGIGEFLGRGVTCQLISSTVVDPSEQSTPPFLPPPCLLSSLTCISNEEGKNVVFKKRKKNRKRQN